MCACAVHIMTKNAFSGKDAGGGPETGMQLGVAKCKRNYKMIIPSRNAHLQLVTLGM